MSKNTIAIVETSPKGTVNLVNLPNTKDCFGLAKVRPDGSIAGIAWATEKTARNEFVKAVAKEVQA
ncbi:hypothetical protein [Aeromonas veronii]|uniref:hypothetical protein n=1 Tax=Aeromonas veronii TaxID=654 RepID=UPI0015D07151|nr:hypothetical protein [Aeromonas veronii]QLH68266.1 hypothetical protein HXV88_18320 [Aeromonas veronii]